MGVHDQLCCSRSELPLNVLHVFSSSHINACVEENGKGLQFSLCFFLVDTPGVFDQHSDVCCLTTTAALTWIFCCWPGWHSNQRTASQCACAGDKLSYSLCW